MSIHTTTLRILHIEDNENDTLLVEAHLRRAGYTPALERVETAAGMAAALAAGPWDLVLSDYALPAFSAPEALRLLRASGQDLPFIIISGAIREDEAVTALRAGAHDFILKDNLARLAPAIARELREAAGRQQQRAAQAALREAEEKYHSLVEKVPVIVYIVTFGQPNRTSYINGQVETLLGFTPAEWLADPDLWKKQLHPDDYQRVLAEVQRADATGQALDIEYRLLNKAGQTRWFRNQTTTVLDAAGRPQYAHGLLIDITHSKQSEIELARERNLLRTLIDNIPDFIYAKDRDSRFILSNQASASTLGHSPEEVVGKTDFELHPAELAEQYRADEQAVMQSGQPLLDNEEMMYQNGQELWQLTSTVPLRDDAGQVVGLVGISRNITERRAEQQQLRAYSQRLQVLAQASQAFAEAGLDYQGLLDRVARQVAEALGDSCLIGLLSDDGEWLNLAAAYSADPAAEAFLRAVAGPAQRLSAGGEAAQVLLTGQPLLAAVIRPDELRAAVPPEHQAGLEQYGYHSALYVALRSPGKNFGLLSLMRYRPERPAFTEPDVSLAQELADRAALAITNARLFGELQVSRASAQVQLDQLAALRAIDQAITASLDLRLTLTVLLDQVSTQLKVDAVDVLLLDPNQKMLSYAAGRGFRSAAGERGRTRLGEGRAGRAALERRRVVDDLRQDRPGTRTGLLNAEHFVSYLGEPLIAKGQVLGVLEIFHRSRLDPTPEWLDFLAALAGQAAIALDNAALFNNLQQTNTDLRLAYEATIEGWSRALDLRDRETEGHSQRVTQLTEQLALAMGMTDKALVHLRRGALLHDIGKMGVPDDILSKPGPLTDAEWVIMRQHPLLAYRMLEPIHYLRPALAIPYCHHEKWDGSGYPRGLKGDLIPLEARIFAVVDVWDALNSDRPYRRAWAAERVRAYLREQAGRHFDPAVVQAFLGLELPN